MDRYDGAALLLTFGWLAVDGGVARLPQCVCGTLGAVAGVSAAARCCWADVAPPTRLCRGDRYVVQEGPQAFQQRLQRRAITAAA